MQFASLGYNVDVVLCFDGSQAMEYFIKEVKADAKRFHTMFMNEMALCESSVNQLRVKVIVFRRFGGDAEPMAQSQFYVLDKDEAAFEAFVEGITPHGEYDGGTNSLEALALAMKLDWNRSGDKRRHCIVLFTGNAAVSLGSCRDCVGYPAGMPANWEELKDWWEGQKMIAKSKRLLLVAPEAEPWNTMIEWTNTIGCFTTEGYACSDWDLETIIRTLVYYL